MRYEDVVQVVYYMDDIKQGTTEPFQGSNFSF